MFRFLIFISCFLSVSAFSHNDKIKLFVFSDVIEIPSYCNLIVNAASELRFSYACNSEPSKPYKSISLEFHINSDKTLNEFRASSILQGFQEESFEQYTHYSAKVIHSDEHEWVSDFNLFCNVSTCLQVISSQTDTSEFVKSIKSQLFK